MASHFNWHYAPMHKALSLIVKKGMEDKDGKSPHQISTVILVLNDVLNDVYSADRYV